MPEIIINGVPVNFPFEPYEVQKHYMEKVIEALQNSSNAVLESPTGTGKTLCLLCATLAWILTKKAQVQACKSGPLEILEDKNKIAPANCLNNIADDLFEKLNSACGSKGGAWGVPKIIYASRTHSQLTQVMAEMKRTSYNFLKAAVIGSRDQLCIHPDVIKESGNSNKLYMCRAKILSKTCSFYSRVEAKKDHTDFTKSGIMDIEDLIKAGNKHKCCPYFISKELIENADIIFMPYNYLLDPKARRANNIELHNSIVILDEAHNVEKMCEESASIQLKSSDLAMCIEEVSNIMQSLNTNQGLDALVSFDDNQDDRSFTIEDLATLKDLLLSLEKVIDDLTVNFSEGTTYPGSYIFELLSSGGINDANVDIIRKLLEDLIQFITTMSENNGLSSRGTGLSLLADMFTIVFASKAEDFKEKVRRCYKVHISIEEQKPQRIARKRDGWISMNSTSNSVKSNAKVVSYWCFNPGFGMTQVLTKNVRSIILTSGTLAPLKPLISELEIPVNVKLENPHIIKNSQVYVKIVANGPDREPLVSNYENRNNPKYIASLGRTILSFCPIIPGGLLVFFPSYTILNKCQEEWTRSGIWHEIGNRKQIFVEPRTKDEFNVVMNEYYAKINDSNAKGAVFMAVCRGKVSEGLDFADNNGRGVIITGLPFPPVKDARVILKRRYLEENRTKENEILSGAEWYGLEAVRAVNQAIGRVIRHKNDYGAILLCDSRFNDRRQKDQLSKWLQSHLKGVEVNASFGKIIGEMSKFFREAERTLPKPEIKSEVYQKKSPNKYENTLSRLNNLLSLDVSPVPKIKIETKASKEFLNVENANTIDTWKPEDYKGADLKVNFNEKPNFFSGFNVNAQSIDFNDISSFNSQYSSKIHKRNSSPELTQDRKKKYKIIQKADIQFKKHDDEVEVMEVKREIIEVNDDSEVPSTSSTHLKSTLTRNILLNSPFTNSLIKRPVSNELVTHESIEKKILALPEDRVELLKVIKSQMRPDKYKTFLQALSDYRQKLDLDKLSNILVTIFNDPTLFHILLSLTRFLKDYHRDNYTTLMKQLIDKNV